MGAFEMVVVIVFIGTVGKVAQEWAGKRSSSAAEGQIRALESALQASEARLTLKEEKVADLSEKLHFVEALLAKPEEHSQLPPSPR